MITQSYMPVEWNFGENPSDGRGGEPPSDAGMIRVWNSDEESESFEEVVHETTIQELIDYAIEGHISRDGKVYDSEAVQIMLSIKQALQKAIDTIDEVIE